MGNLIESIKEVQTSDTKLDTQIIFMKSLNSIVRTPLTISIYNSLEELKGIKQKQLEKLKAKNLK